MNKPDDANAFKELNLISWRFAVEIVDTNAPEAMTSCFGQSKTVFFIKTNPSARFN